MASARTARLWVRVPTAPDALSSRRFYRESPEPGGRLQVLGLLGRLARMFRAPAIRLFGTVDFVRGGLQALFHRRLRVRHAYHDLFFLALAAHRPMRSRICRAWWRAWMTWKRIHSSTVKSPMRGCFTNRSVRRSGNSARST